MMLLLRLLNEENVTCMCGCVTILFIILQVKNKPWLQWLNSWDQRCHKQVVESSCARILIYRKVKTCCWYLVAVIIFIYCSGESSAALFNVAESQNLLLNMWRPVNICRWLCSSASNLTATYYSSQSSEIATSQKQKLWVGPPLPLKGQSNQKPPMDKIYYPRPKRSIVENCASWNVCFVLSLCSNLWYI